MPHDLRRVSRALLSVSDKTGLVPFAQALSARGVALLSTGGTRATLLAAGLPVAEVSDLTGFPEMMDGRVKTLHPAVHGGLLAVRSNPEHQAAMMAHGIGAIDLLVVNLYPFEDAVAAGRPPEACLELIDIGGPAMMRAAAKNHADVTVAVDPADYPAILTDLEARAGAVASATRRRLAGKAFARTAAYDAAIAAWFADGAAEEDAPAFRTLGGRLVSAMRYGENPHQAGGALPSRPSPPGSRPPPRQVQAALLQQRRGPTRPRMRGEFEPAVGAAVVIVKHANPCGVATRRRSLPPHAGRWTAIPCQPSAASCGEQSLDRRPPRAIVADVHGGDRRAKRTRRRGRSCGPQEPRAFC
jgi:phosphoribosylaminoimidazolecarboxamide formyltransferase/IMP cyclohydrolase